MCKQSMFLLWKTKPNSCAYPKKRVQHVAHATTSTTTQGPEEKGNKDVQS
jgi:hypothetical protein